MLEKKFFVLSQWLARRGLIVLKRVPTCLIPDRVIKSCFHIVAQHSRHARLDWITVYIHLFDQTEWSRKWFLTKLHLAQQPSHQIGISWGKMVLPGQIRFAASRIIYKEQLHVCSGPTCFFCTVWKGKTDIYTLPCNPFSWAWWVRCSITASQYGIRWSHLTTERIQISKSPLEILAIVEWFSIIKADIWLGDVPRANGNVS